MARKKKSRSKSSSILTVLVFTFLAVYYALTGGESNTVDVVSSNYTSNEVVSVANESEVSGDLEIYYFDVGQADCIFVKNEDECMLIDAGNNADGKLIAKELESLGVQKINYLIGTHPHEDHVGGLDDIIEEFDIGKIYMPKREANTATFEDILDAVSDKNLKISTPNVGDKFNVGEATCEILSVDSDAEDTNDSSIVILMTFGKTSYLFTGDIGSEIEENVDWSDIDVLKVAHHGSKYSSSKEFLAETTPEVAVISCGRDNDYGHPHDEAVKRIENIGAEIYRTDKQGTIYIKSDGNKYDISELDICLDGNWLMRWLRCDMLLIG